MYTQGQPGSAPPYCLKYASSWSWLTVEVLKRSLQSEHSSSSSSSAAVVVVDGAALVVVVVVVVFDCGFTSSAQIFEYLNIICFIEIK